jgi:Domain of unknown function (DUF4136)
MKNLWFLPLLLTGLIIAGCSSTAPTRVDKGSLRVHTYNFINGGIALTPPATNRRDAIHQLIQKAIINGLTAKGLQRTDGTGDVTVAYMIIVGNNVSTEAVTTYFGMGRDSDALHNKAQDAYTSSQNPNRFEAGTLVIDVLDAKTYELLYRNYVVRPILGNVTAAVRGERVQEAVDTALANLRIAN